MSRSLATPISRSILAFLACILTLGIGLRWFATDAGNGIELLARDLATPVLSPSGGTAGIALIDIDEVSIGRVEPWPWRRSRLADLVDKTIGVYEAKLAVLDVVLPDPRDPEGDSRILKLSQQRRLVLAQVFDFVDRDTPIISGIPAGALVRPNINEGLSEGTKAAIPATGVVANHAGLRGAPCVGNIGFIPDSDGKLRRIVQRAEWDGFLYPSLSLAVISCASDPVSKISSRKSPLVDLRDREALLPLRFDIAPSSFTVISAHEVLNSADQINPVLLNKLQDKIVIIGSSALGLSDRVSTPRSPSVSGMFVHAQALSEVMYPRLPFASVWSKLTTMVIQIAIVLAFVLAVVLSRSLTALLGFSVLILMFWFFVFFIQIDANNQHLLTPALWGVGFLGLTLIPLEWSQARAQSRARAKILARYVSRPVLKDLLKEQNFDPLKPRSAEITVLVADMVSYSQTVAEQPLDGAATMTKEFLEAITEPIWSLRGTLDRYTGDGLIAFWGAPIAVPNHAELAVKAAIQMRTRIDELNQRNSHRGLPHVQVRIGVASGSAIVGDFGTDLRANYTAVGTCINMASRLEATAKTLGFSTIISESTAESISGGSLVLLGEYDIRGLGPLRLFTLNDSLER